MKNALLLTQENLGIDSRLAVFKTFVYADQSGSLVFEYKDLDLYLDQNELTQVLNKINELKGKAGYIGLNTRKLYFEIQWD